jgi:3-oxoacyl-[acyl-carrier protein] reductase
VDIDFNAARESAARFNRTTAYACDLEDPDSLKVLHQKLSDISSLAAHVGGMDVGVHYTTSKAGVIGLTRSFAKKLGPFGINVNAVAPGIMLTEPVKRHLAGREDEYIAAIPLRRLGQPEDVAHAVLFLSSPMSDYITGCVLDVNGGSYMN